MIELINLSKVYPSKSGGFVALGNVNLKIDDGDVFGIIGLSGAGKSTLVRCINLLEKPTSGSVIRDGEDLTKASNARLRAVRRKVSMIFQQFNLLQQRSVLKNVELAGEIGEDTDKKEKKANGKERKTDRKRKAIKLLETVGLGDKLNAYPSELSGGQQQRVAIARALATDPEIIYFDEPTSALDPELTGEVLGVMRQLAKEGMTMLVVTHEMGFAKNVSNKVVFMENGVVVEEGPSKEFFANPREERTRAFLQNIEQHYE